MDNYTLPQFFAAFPEVNMAGFSKSSGIAHSLIRYYKTNPNASISPERLQALQDAINDLGLRLARVRLR